MLSTDLQKQVELVEVQCIDDQLLSLLACEPETRARHRLLADKHRLMVLELRHTAHRRAK